MGKWGAHHGDNWRETEAAFAKEITKMCFTTESKAKAEKCWKFMPWASGMIKQNTSRRCRKPLPEEQQTGLNLARFVLSCPGRSTHRQSSNMRIISENYKVPTEVWLLKKTNKNIFDLRYISPIQKDFSIVEVWWLHIPDINNSKALFHDYLEHKA